LALRRGASAGSRRGLEACLSLASSLFVLLLCHRAEAQTASYGADQQGANVPIQGAADAALQAGAADIGQDGTTQGTEQRPGFVFSPSGTLQGTFTDNVLLVPSHAQSDWLNTVTGTLDVTGKLERTQVALDYSVSGDFYTENSRLDGYRQNLLTIDRFEPVKGVFLIDLRAAVDQEQIAQTGPQAATLRSGLVNQTQVANASITPSYVEHWGNWAVSTLSYSLNEVMYFDGGNNSTSNNLNNSTQQDITAQLANGSAFTRTTWGLTVSDDISRGGGSDLDQQTAEADAEYRINTTFRVPVTVGYDNFAQTGSGLSSSNISGLFWNTGIHLVPGPRTDLTLRYGRRYDKPYESGSLTYHILANMDLTASYDEAVQTQQQGLASNLQGLSINPNGSIVNPVGLPGSPNQTQNDLINGIYRSRTFQFGVSGTHGLNFFSLSGQAETRSFGTAQGSDRTESVSGSIGRTLSPRASINLSVGTGHTVDTGTVLDQGSSSDLTTSVDYSYKLNDKTDAGINVARRHQTGTFKTDEDAIVLRLSHKF
jgi:uncharacterized protein (PEP-CTERM system associated)